MDPSSKDAMEEDDNRRLTGLPWTDGSWIETERSWIEIALGTRSERVRVSLVESFRSCCGKREESWIGLEEWTVGEMSGMEVGLGWMEGEEYCWLVL